jgi:hypothetical protein
VLAPLFAAGLAFQPHPPSNRLTDDQLPIQQQPTLSALLRFLSCCTDILPLSFISFIVFHLSLICRRAYLRAVLTSIWYTHEQSASSLLTARNSTFNGPAHRETPDPSAEGCTFANSARSSNHPLVGTLTSGAARAPLPVLDVKTICQPRRTQGRCRRPLEHRRAPMAEVNGWQRVDV